MSTLHKRLGMGEPGLRGKDRIETEVGIIQSRRLNDPQKSAPTNRTKSHRHRLDLSCVWISANLGKMLREKMNLLYRYSV
jgi:hypothetical protein